VGNAPTKDKPYPVVSRVSERIRSEPFHCNAKASIFLVVSFRSSIRMLKSGFVFITGLEWISQLVHPSKEVHCMQNRGNRYNCYLILLGLQKSEIFQHFRRTFITNCWFPFYSIILSWYSHVKHSTETSFCLNFKHFPASHSLSAAGDVRRRRASQSQGQVMCVAGISASLKGVYAPQVP